MSTTIKEIADLAKVSRGTVDKVLHNRPGVKKETRELVLKIIKETGYKPNLIGKMLSNNNKPITIGVILTPDYNPFIQEIIIGIKNAEEELSAFNLEVLIRMTLTLEVAEQLAILNEFDSLGVDGIAVFPFNNKVIVDKLNGLSKKGIAIITFNSKIDNILDLCFVGQDHIKGGKTAAGLMTKFLNDNSDIGVIISSKNLTCHRDRLQGFKNRILESKKHINIVKIIENFDKKEIAFSATLELINKYPNIKGIYVTGGGIYGVGNALKLANKSLFLICHDLLNDSKILLEENIIDFVITQNPKEQGYQVIKILFDFLFKNMMPVDKFYEIPIHIQTKDSIWIRNIIFIY